MVTLTHVRVPLSGPPVGVLVPPSTPGQGPSATPSVALPGAGCQAAASTPLLPRLSQASAVAGATDKPGSRVVRPVCFDAMLMLLAIAHTLVRPVCFEAMLMLLAIAHTLVRPVCFYVLLLAIAHTLVRPVCFYAILMLMLMSIANTDHCWSLNG